MASDLLSRRAAASPRAVAVEAPDGARSYRALHAAADGLAAGLRAAGLGRGEVLAGLLPVSPAGIAAVHGVPRAGLALAPAGTGWTVAELERFLRALRPSGLLAPIGAGCPGADGEAGAPGKTALPGDAVGGPAGRLLAESGFRLFRSATERRAGSGDRRAVPAGTHTVIWTSGTAGSPRAVPLALANHLAVARGGARRLALGSADRWLASLALSHVGGLALVLRAAYTGARLVTRAERFRAAEADRLAREGRITHASLVPAMLHRWLEELGGRAAPGGLRAVLVGGAPTPPALLERSLSAGFPVALTYGLTEAASQVATAPPELVRRKPGTAGPPLGGVRLRLVDGEIRVRGRSVMRGYLDPAAAALAASSAHGSSAPPPAPSVGRARGEGEGGGEPFDERGWLRTGDVGELDSEGHLWVRGRLGDRIVTGGVNVDPAEVEAALDGAPGIAELAVTSVPDPVWGERLVAVAAPRSPSGIDAEGLDRLARARLSSPRRPRAWIVVPALPRNPNGKVDRAALRRLAERRLASADEEARC